MTIRVSTFSFRLLDARLGLHRAAPALEGERPGDDADGERAEALGDLGDDRGAAGAGAAALAGGDEDHVGALEHLLDLVAVLLGGLAADLGVAAGAEAAGQLAADVELHVGVAHEQRLGVGVDGDELDALAGPASIMRLTALHAAAADADHLDDGEVVLRVAGHGSRHLQRLRGGDAAGTVGYGEDPLPTCARTEPAVEVESE